MNSVFTQCKANTPSGVDLRVLRFTSNLLFCLLKTPVGLNKINRIELDLSTIQTLVCMIALIIGNGALIVVSDQSLICIQPDLLVLILSDTDILNN